MSLRYKFIRNIAILFGLLTLAWVFYDSIKNYKSLNSDYLKANSNYLEKNYKESLDSKKFNIVEFTEYELPWFYTIKLNEVKIEELISYLSSKKIESRMLYPPLNKQNFLEEYANVDITSSLNTFEKYLWLPSSTKLTDEQLEYISSTLNSF